MTNQYGYTLIEMVIVIAIIGIISGIALDFVTAPLLVYDQVRTRTELLDQGDSAIRRMVRDVRRALPNSIRVGTPALNQRRIDFFHVLEAAPYRRSSPAPFNDPNNRLDISVGDRQFNILGAFDAGSPLDPPVAPATTRVRNMRIAINTTNTDTVWQDAAAADTASGLGNPTNGVITGVNSDFFVFRFDPGGGLDPEDRIRMNIAHSFDNHSPTGRVFFVDDVVSYTCDTATRQLDRRAGYSPKDTFANTTTELATAIPSIVPSIMMDQVAGCRFSFDPGTEERAAIVSVEIRLVSVRYPNEPISLMRQAQIGNSP